MPPLPVARFENDLPEIIRLLRKLVEQESPTTEKSAVDTLGALIAGEMRSLGAEVRRYPQTEAGDHWLGDWGEGTGGLLLLAHMDTVYPLGTLETMPWREEAGFLHGPGVLDMKAGIAIALTAIRHLRASGRMPTTRISLLCTSDEETGSHTSRALIESLAAGRSLVLCLEPALPDGSLKTWRKGTLDFRLEARGVSAHAGADPDRGVNAIAEMAHQIPLVLEQADLGLGTTLNLGVIRGGTRTNVVPEHCTLLVDGRAKTIAEGDRLIRSLKALKPILPGAELRVEAAWNRPPMERTPQIAASYEKAKALAASLGLPLGEGGTGGASDANFVAPLGVPVLDGLGGVGEGPHSPGERVLARSLAERAALLAALLTEG